MCLKVIFNSHMKCCYSVLYMSGIYKAHSAHKLTKNSRERDGPLGFLFPIYIPTLPPPRFSL